MAVVDFRLWVFGEERGTHGRVGQEGGAGSMSVPEAAVDLPPHRSLEVRRALVESVRESLADGEGVVSVLYSGGLDSSLVARACQEVGARMELVTVGLPGSPDIERARRGARWFGIDPHVRTLNPPIVQTAARRVWALLGPLSGLRLSLMTSLYLAVQATEGSQVLCGQGADELFLGYRHFETLSGESLEQKAREDWERLIRVDWPATLRLAEEAGRRIGSPFLSPRLWKISQSIPLPERRGKAPLRGAARDWGLPESMVAAPKKAIQYGSGIASVLRRYRPPDGG
jgi:asparagine synthase (glutamine-hydrolysing)